MSVNAEMKHMSYRQYRTLTLGGILGVEGLEIRHDSDLGLEKRKAVGVDSREKCGCWLFKA